jgi:hypothetical protein
VDVYSDNDISAYAGKRRPEYERMLADLKSGRVNAVIAWHPDRLHRRAVELEPFIDVVEAAEAVVKTCTAGELDLSTPSGRMVARILGVAARHEVEPAFAEGQREAGVFTVLKHFPGHGRADGDSHRGRVTTPPLDDLRAADLQPYATLLGPGARLADGRTGVLVGHLEVPGLTGELPRSLAPEVYTLLRDEYGFDGLVLTDDLGAMDAITDEFTFPKPSSGHSRPARTSRSGRAAGGSHPCWTTWRPPWRPAGSRRTPTRQRSAASCARIAPAPEPGTPFHRASGVGETARGRSPRTATASGGSGT